MLNITKRLPAILLMAATCLLINSCEKDQPDCTGNCVSVRISGRVYDKTSGMGFKDVPVEVKWVKACIGCTSYKIAEGNTKNDGSFDFTKIIDSSFFDNYSLIVRIPNDTNYVSPFDFHSNIYHQKDFGFLNLNALQQVEFQLFPKTLLKINLHRVQNDAFNIFSLKSIYTGYYSAGGYSVVGQQNARDTTLFFRTAAGVLTKIVYGKTLSGNQQNDRLDSIFCTQTGANTLDINY